MSAYVGYQISLGILSAGGPMVDRDPGPAVLGTVTALSAPKALNGWDFVTYLPYYVTRAYRRSPEQARGVRVTVTVTMDLDARGVSSNIRVDAPGVSPGIVEEARRRAQNTHTSCGELPATSTVRVTIVAEPRTRTRAGGP